MNQSDKSIDRYREILKEARAHGYSENVKDFYIGVLLTYLTPEEIKKAEDFALGKIKKKIMINKLTREFINSIKPEIPTYKVYEIYEHLISRLIDKLRDELPEQKIREILKEVKEEMR